MDPTGTLVEPSVRIVWNVAWFGIFLGSEVPTPMDRASFARPRRGRSAAFCGKCMAQNDPERQRRLFLPRAPQPSQVVSDDDSSRTRYSPSSGRTLNDDSGSQSPILDETTSHSTMDESIDSGSMEVGQATLVVEALPPWPLRPVRYRMRPHLAASNHAVYEVVSSWRFTRRSRGDPWRL